MFAIFAFPLVTIMHNSSSACMQHCIICCSCRVYKIPTYFLDLSFCLSLKVHSFCSGAHCKYFPNPGELQGVGVLPGFIGVGWLDYFNAFVLYPFISILMYTSSWFHFTSIQSTWIPTNLMLGCPLPDHELRGFTLCNMFRHKNQRI